VSFLFL